ncbi:hypothetical protein SAMD00023353_0103390 [Rosellinia necatrix]|uniref:Uncharacterized protein n=1 Tax=Rosellinia necatrix TaxID=77044 RepID=A0A1S8A4P5_ROSNE|nr:hypothetical protein SAMD00023353_0103390 [Rosellinia necatrix]
MAAASPLVQATRHSTPTGIPPERKTSSSSSSSSWLRSIFRLSIFGSPRAPPKATQDLGFPGQHAVVELGSPETHRGIRRRPAPHRKLARRQPGAYLSLE